MDDPKMSAAEKQQQKEVAELEELATQLKRQRGGKPAKYPELEKHSKMIVGLMDQKVSLPAILEWLQSKHGEEIVLNTLRKFVIYKMGRESYDDYLERNGWKRNRSERSNKTATKKVPLKPLETKPAIAPILTSTEIGEPENPFAQAANVVEEAEKTKDPRRNN